MSFTTDLLEGLAQLLATAGAGTWDPDGSSGTIYRGALPDDVSTGIGIQGYRIGADDPEHPTTQQRVQFWLRAPTQAAVDDLDAAVYTAIQGLTDVSFGTAHVTQAVSLSSIPQGIDGNGRVEHSSNYTFDLDLQSSALRSY